MTNDKYGFQVFISYSSKNYDYVEKIKEALEDRGVTCWMANASTITNGEFFCTRIVEAISNCKIVLIILSKESIGSTWVSLEITHALHENKKIYTLRTDDSELTELLSFKLGCSQICDCTVNTTAVIESLAINIKKETDKILSKNLIEIAENRNSFLINYMDYPLFLITIFASIIFVVFLICILISFTVSDISDELFNILNGLFSISLVFPPIIIIPIISLIRIALYLYIKNVAEINSSKALFIMYKYHKNNIFFFRKNKEKALYYLNSSAKYDYYLAYYELSNLYKKGLLVEKDYELSREYYEKGKNIEEITLISK